MTQPQLARVPQKSDCPQWSMLKERDVKSPLKLLLLSARAIEVAGIELIDENGGGEGVRLRKPRRSSHGKGVDRRPKRG